MSEHLDLIARARKALLTHDGCGLAEKTRLFDALAAALRGAAPDTTLPEERERLADLFLAHGFRSAGTVSGVYVVLCSGCDWRHEPGNAADAMGHREHLKHALGEVAHLLRSSPSARLDVEGEWSDGGKVFTPAVPQATTPPERARIEGELRHGWQVWHGVECVECPGCGFRMDAAHTDDGSGGYTCPNCADTLARPVAPEGEVFACLRRYDPELQQMVFEPLDPVLRATRPHQEGEKA